MTDETSAPAGALSPFSFPYYSLRNITSPEDKDAGREVYVGQAPLSSILDLPVDENVREFLPENKKRKVYSQVHWAIWDTLKYRPEEFSVLNGGVAIVTGIADVQDKDRLLRLYNASIINGAQTQGVVRDFYQHLEDRNLPYPDPEPHVKFEIIVSDDADLIAEVSIARNFQNDVARVSLAGRRGYLDELEESFRRDHPRLRLRKSETDVPYEDNTIVNTERLIQVIAALVPEELWVKNGEFNKVYTYSQKTKCLKEFEDIYLAAKNVEHRMHEGNARLYQFYLDIAGQAYDLYRTWKRHQGFRGTGLHSLKRGPNGEIEDVPDGIVFPILASLSVFAVETDDGWKILKPQIDNELIQTAKTNYIEVARSNPNSMGKSRACYNQLSQLTSIAKSWMPRPFTA